MVAFGTSSANEIDWIKNGFNITLDTEKQTEKLHHQPTTPAPVASGCAEPAGQVLKEKN